MTVHSLAPARRGCWLPPLPLIGAKYLELRRRRVLMSITAAFTVATPVIFYGIREISHLSDPVRYGPAGSPDALASIVTLMAQFGFVVAVMFGATAGTTDLTDGMFRHLVITGRSRFALYLARIPAGLSILLSLAAVGFTVTALATAFLGGQQPARMVAALPGDLFRSGLWFELYLVIGFTVGLGLGSLVGQRTVPVVLLTVWQIIITPALATHVLPHLMNAQRLAVGVAMYQLKPAVLAGGVIVSPNGGEQLALPPMPTWAIAAVVTGWIIGWLAIGAWKMATRDA